MPKIKTISTIFHKPIAYNDKQQTVKNNKFHTKYEQEKNNTKIKMPIYIKYISIQIQLTASLQQT